MKTSRRSFLSTTAAATVPLSLKAEEKLFSVGLIADAQYVDANPGGIRHYKESIRKLGVAVASLNASKVEFSIHLGDLIDRDFRSFDAILEPLNQLKKPIFQILGNHDFDVEEDKKPEVMHKMGIEKPFYSFSRQGFRFVFLDGTEISTFAHPKGTQEYKIGLERLGELKQLKRKNARPWNAAIGPAQMVWLRKQLEAAFEMEEKVVLSCHYPILPDNSHNLWNDQEVLALLEEFPGTVVAWFNGHNHAGNYAKRNGIHFVTIQGMVDTPDSNAYGVLDIYPGLLKIRGSGRVPDRVLEFGS